MSHICLYKPPVLGGFSLYTIMSLEKKGMTVRLRERYKHGSMKTSHASDKSLLCYLNPIYVCGVGSGDRRLRVCVLCQHGMAPFYSGENDLSHCSMCGWSISLCCMLVVKKKEGRRRGGRWAGFLSPIIAAAALSSELWRRKAC